jgi:A-macroglobulin TED domain/Alpha-2-macroglobulin family/Carboxypeptidase regulatory-like domain/A-macroglobulin receptor binding domain
MAWNSRGQVLFSRNLQLKDGNVSVDIPYDPRFGKELALGVVSGALGSAASRMVVFPCAEDLRLRVSPVKNEYRPGETARIEFSASAPSVLGVAVTDQSVFERASTDAALAARRWFEFENNWQNRLGGIGYSDLLNLDPAKIDDDLQQVAEVLVGNPHFQESVDETLDNQRNAYMVAAARGLQRLQRALDEHYQNTLDYPGNYESYLRIADTVSASFEDPWMDPYVTRFSTEGPNDVLRIVSQGPDKRLGTSDDFCALEIDRKWFGRFESVIRDSLVRLDDYPATNDEFIRLVDTAGIRFDHLRDPWGTPLRSAIAYNRDSRVIRITSAGPDRHWGTDDDFTVVEFTGSYFSAAGLKIEQALRRAKQFPRTESDFRTALAAAGLNLDEMRDPWARRYYVSFHSEESYYDRPQIYTYEEYRGLRESRKQLIPAKRLFLVADVRSVGEDGSADTDDDFTVMSFFRAVDSSSPQPPHDRKQPAPPRLSPRGTGSIAGVLVDPSGEGISNAQVTLNDTYTTHTDHRGEYIFRGMPSGHFRLKFEAPGFQTGLIDHVPVEPDHVTKADFVLQIGSLSQSVEVTAPNAIKSAPVATPHVREYFPETLYWNPELVTDSAGHAAAEVKLADTITTWHMAIIASTEDGRITEASTDIRAFQPFQVDLDVPGVLTAGDRIILPVPVRNYLEQPQEVKVAAKAPQGLELEQPPQQPGSVSPSASANAFLSLRAETAREDARLRVTAIGRTASDAIEKAIVIHPDGERLERSVTGIVSDGQVLRADIPPNLIAGSIKAEVKIYPTLMARLLEATEALLQRPYGCGEQTISSTYPNLLFLEAMKRDGLADAKLEARAMRNLRAGYAKLLGYQSDDGGFRYWATGQPDAALTAYALKFLVDAKEFLEIDQDRVNAAQTWLKQQNLNEDSLRALTLWTLVEADARDGAASIRRLGDFARKAAEFDDPYSIAAFALAAMDAGRGDLAESSIRRLAELARDEQGAAYWALRANTPFHGWGRAGQVETTALVLSALAKWRRLGGNGMELAPLIERGAVFLLKNTDSSGAWSSSQSTVRALLSLLEIWPVTAQADLSSVEVVVNGANAGKLTVANGRTIAGPMILDVSRLIRPGAANEISLRTNSTRAIQVQFNASWYQTWTRLPAGKDFTMETKFSTNTAAINQAVMCDVNVSRPAFRGYGMMIAEVGLPPGVEVDRGTLASVIDDPKSGVDSFEVAPGHVTFYIWPRASDSRFKFVFRPRFAMKARMAQSALYDYYNPEERVLLVPQNFTVN